MFLVAPAQGLGTGFWAHEWVKVWDLSKHPISRRVQGMPLLQSPMQNGSWSGKRIASARFVAWVKALLATGGSGMGDLMTGHSAKATALSWLNKAHVSRDDSAILGHHVVKSDRTVLAYSRDHQAGPLRTLECVYRDIREGRFLPDCTRSGYYPGDAHSMQSPAQLRSHDSELPVERDAKQSWYRSNTSQRELQWSPCQSALDAAADQEGEGSPDCSGSTQSSESSSSSSSDEDMDEDLDQCHEDGRSLVHQVRESCLVYRQIKTKTLHLLPLGSASDRFICGRSKAASHKPFKASVEVQHWWCKQCRQGKPLRDMGSMTEALDQAVKRARREA